MKIQNLVLLIFGSVVLTAGAMTFGYFLTQTDTEDEEPARSQTTAQVQGETSLNVNTSGGAGQLFGTGDTSPSSAPNNNQNQQNDLPGPEGFEVYEQYSDAESVLYADIVLGDGNEARPGDTVAMKYQGWLTDGTLFDSSRVNEQGQVEPFVFTLGQGQVIRGWEEGIQGMKVGGKRRLVIPAVAAYGEAGQGQIPPNAMLVFDVELAQIEKAPAPPTGL